VRKLQADKNKALADAASLRRQLGDITNDTPAHCRKRSRSPSANSEDGSAHYKLYVALIRGPTAGLMFMKGEIVYPQAENMAKIHTQHPSNFTGWDCDHLHACVLLRLSYLRFVTDFEFF